MTLYVRGYADYSYEIIYLEGKFRKSRVHILINPGKYTKLPGQGKENDVELNIESLTHILSMETSVKNPDLIKRTIYIAERTNKPIITNQETAERFREGGLSVRQLRIIGFEQEVVEGIHVDPVYLDELSDEIKSPHEDKSSGLDNVMNVVNPFKWKPIKKLTKTITNTILPGNHEEESKIEIDASKPLAFHLELGSKVNILLPLDKRGVEHINQILPQLDIQSVVVPNMDVGYTSKIEGNLSKLIILNGSVKEDEVLTLPKSHNPGINHDTYYGSLAEWIEIK